MKRRLIALAAALALVPIILRPRPEPPAPRGFGWINDPAAVEAVRQSLPNAEFALTEACRDSREEPDDVYLWDACRRVTGDVLPPRDQGGVGACVGFGAAAAIEHLICIQALQSDDEEYRTLAPEIIYAGSRVEIGGGRVRGDGSVGAWAARFVQNYGVLPRARYPSLDLTNYNESRCRQLGRRGVPDNLEPIAKENPVRTIANVRSWRECQAALRNGYPQIVCSSQGFTMARDADGFCQPDGTWMHCLAIVGLRGGVRPGAFLLNSWGATAHTGPLGPGDPSPAGFWADADVVDRMLRQGDSWAFSQFQGFPARTIDWSALRTRNPSTVQ